MLQRPKEVECLRKDRFGNCLEYEKIMTPHKGIYSSKSHHGLRPSPPKPGPPAPGPSRPDTPSKPDRPPKTIPDAPDDNGLPSAPVDVNEQRRRDMRRNRPFIIRPSKSAADSTLSDLDIQRAHMVRASQLMNEEGLGSAQSYLDEQNVPFDIDPELSTSDHIALLPNDEALAAGRKPEIAARGIKMDSKEDWKNLYDSVATPDHEKTYKDLKATHDAMVEQYGEVGHVSGYSHGGHKAIKLGDETGVDITAFNPVIDHNQIMDAGKFLSDTTQEGIEMGELLTSAGRARLSEQVSTMPERIAAGRGGETTIIRTVNDGASAIGTTLTPRGWDVKTVGELQESSNPLKSHSLDNFTAPKGKATFKDNLLHKATHEHVKTGAKAAETEMVQDMVDNQMRGKSFTEYVKDFSPVDANYTHRYGGESGTRFTQEGQLSNRLRKHAELWKKTGGELTAAEEFKVGDQGRFKRQYMEDYGRTNPKTGERTLPKPKTFLNDGEISDIVDATRDSPGRATSPNNFVEGQKLKDIKEQNAKDLRRSAENLERASEGIKPMSKGYLEKAVETGVSDPVDLAMAKGKDIIKNAGTSASETIDEHVGSALNPSSIATGVVAAHIGNKLADDILGSGYDDGSLSHHTAKTALSGATTGVVQTGLETAGKGIKNVVKGLANPTTAAEVAESAATGVVGGVVGGLAQEGTEVLLDKATGGPSEAHSAGEATKTTISSAVGGAATGYTGAVVGAGLLAAGGAEEGATIGAILAPETAGASVLVGAGIGAAMGLGGALIGDVGQTKVGKTISKGASDIWHAATDWI